MAIQVVNATGNVLWTTDKVEIATSAANVTFQVSVVQLTYVQANGVPANATMTTPTGNLYANSIVVGSNTTQQFFVGAGNYLNISLPLYLECDAGDQLRMEIINITNNNDPTVRSAVFYLSYLHD